MAVEAAEAAQVVPDLIRVLEVELGEARSQVWLNATARFGELSPGEGGSQGVTEAWGWRGGGIG